MPTFEPIDPVEPEAGLFRPPPRPETTGRASSEPLADELGEEEEESDPEESEEDELGADEPTRALPAPARAATAVRGSSFAQPSLIPPCLEPLLFGMAGFLRGLVRGLRAFALMPRDMSSSSSSSSEAADPDSLVFPLGALVPTCVAGEGRMEGSTTLHTGKTAETLVVHFKRQRETKRS